MRTNGTWHDIPNTTHLREKQGRKEGGRCLKSTQSNGKSQTPKPIEHSRSAHIYILAYAPFLQGAYENGIKQISMIEMAIKETRKQVNRQEGKQTRKQTKGGVCKGQMQVWIRYPQLHCVEVWTTHQQARLMHGHVNKRVKVHRNPTGGTNEHGKHIIARSGKGERYAQSNRHCGDASQMVTSKQGLMGVGYNHTTTNLLRASSVAKPRSKQA